MKYLLLSVVAVVSFKAEAAKLECQTRINLEPVASTVVVTEKNKRMLIDEGSEAVSYVTEVGPNSFTIEAYLYTHDLRIYSQGVLGDSLSLSTWARESMLDVICKPVK